MVAALSAAARLGILIKNVADIELAAKINAFIFDKTGTLTTGQLAVSRLAPIGDIKPGVSLIIVLPERANVHYGFDGWQNVSDATTTPNALGVQPN